MKITIEVPHDLASYCVEEDRALVITPEFSTSRGKCHFLSVRVESDCGKELDEFTLMVSGADGLVSKKPRVVAKALADMTEEERTALRNGSNEDND